MPKDPPLWGVEKDYRMECETKKEKRGFVGQGGFGPRVLPYREGRKIVEWSVKKNKNSLVVQGKRQQGFGILRSLWKTHKLKRICDARINLEKYKEKDPTYVWEQRRARVFLSHERYTKEEYLRFFLGRVLGCYNQVEFCIQNEWNHMWVCINPYKREYIIVFGMNHINLRIIVNLFRVDHVVYFFKANGFFM